MTYLRCPGCLEPASFRVTSDRHGVPTGFCSWCQSRSFLDSTATLDRIVAGQAALADLVERHGGARACQATAAHPNLAAPPASTARCPCCGEAGGAMVRLDRKLRPMVLTRCCRVRTFVGLPVGLTSILLSCPGVIHAISSVTAPATQQDTVATAGAERNSHGLG